MYNKISIIGYGWLGQAIEKMFSGRIHEINIYDPMEVGNFGFEKSAAELPKDSIAFIGVPTPLDEEAKTLDMSCLDKAIHDCPCDIIVVRSTPNMGYLEAVAKATKKRIVYQPEFLGETPNHPMNDGQDFMVFGGSSHDIRDVIELYTKVINANVKIRQMSFDEATLVKLSDNRAMMLKVLQCQELYDLCEASGMDYYKIRDVVYGDDPRNNLWGSFIYPNARGCNSKCIPKDIYSWDTFAEEMGLPVGLTGMALRYNQDLLKRHHS